MARSRTAASRSQDVAFRRAQDFAASLRRRFFLRGHMTLILAATVGVGVLAHAGLLRLSLHLALRLGLAVTAAYLAFFLLVRAWLWLIGPSSSPPSHPARVDAGDVLDGALELGGEVVPDAGPELPSLDGDLGDGPVIFGVVLVALGVVIAAAILVWNAPLILGEAAFEVALVAALGPRARLLDRPGWSGSVLRTTVVPYLLMLAVAVIAGFAATAYCPDIVRLRDLLSGVCGG